MRNLKNEVRALHEVVIEKTSFSGKGLDALGKQVVFSVLRQFFELQAITHELLDKPLNQKHIDLELLIMCGLYAVDHLAQPVHTSVNAAVETSKAFNKAWARGLVNATLRRYLRDAQNIRHKALTSDAAISNHPDWFTASVQQYWPEHYQHIIDANNTPAPMHLRINCQKISRDDYITKLKAEDLGCIESQHSPNCLTLMEPVPVERLPAFKQGFVSVQDEAAQLATLIFKPVAGDHILDACAAPGSKSCHLLEVEPGITLTSIDSNSDRLAMVQDNFTRLGLQGDIIHQDLLQIDDDQLACFDKILLDAPCSATGVIRRHPDIKLLRQANDIDKLVSIQRQLLENCWRMLKPEGSLVYVTCSILPQENEHLVTAFVQQHSDAETIDIPLSIGHRQSLGYQLLPTVGSHDGFYFAHLKKTSASIML